MPVVLLLELLELELDELFVAGADVGIVGMVAASTAIIASSNPDIDAAARSEHAAVGSSRDLCRNGVFFGDDDALRIAAGAVVAIAPRRRLVAQAELQSRVAGLQTGVFQRLLKPRRIVTQHVERRRPFHCQMRGDIAVLVDVEAHIDAANSAGSRRISKRLLPPAARSAMSAARPFSGTGALSARVVFAAGTGIAVRLAAWV